MIQEFADNCGYVPHGVCVGVELPVVLKHVVGSDECMKAPACGAIVDPSSVLVNVHLPVKDEGETCVMSGANSMLVFTFLS